MTTPLRDRADHAARYDANLVVPARDIKDLLDTLDKAEAARDDARSEARALAEELDRARLAESLHLEQAATLARLRGLLENRDRHSYGLIKIDDLRAALTEDGDRS